MKSADYYDRNANEFFAATVTAEMSDVHGRFLQHLPSGGHILDAGCGSGRDTLVFLKSGYSVTAFDASAEMVKRATEYCRTPVMQMSFQEVAWDNEFDGVWACASLLHVLQADLSGVIQKLAKALRPAGVLYGSFKYGVGEVEREGRLFTNHTEATLAELIKTVPDLKPVDVWLTQDVRPGRTDTWLNLLYQRKY